MSITGNGIPDSLRTMKRDRPYDGQPHTDEGVRGTTEIKGVTLRDLQDAYVRAVCLASGAAHPDNMPFYTEAEKGENATLHSSDIYRLKNKPDGMAIFHNLSTEIEKLMGIFPNVPQANHFDVHEVDPSIPSGIAVVGGPRW